jgi:hypothetical protein
MPGYAELSKQLAAIRNIHAKIAADVPSIARGQVWCRKCGHMQKVNGAHCLAHGWPKHCGATMSIEPPEAC